MRDIKFRAWDKNAKRFIGKPQDRLLADGDGIVLIIYKPHPSGTWEPEPPKVFTWAEMKNIEVNCYTGFKDKNGVEIYEGDIVKVTEKDEPTEWVGKVQWNVWCYQVVSVRQSNWFEDLHLNLKIEVIGNIYENKELLK